MRRAAAGLAGLALAACSPELTDDTSIVHAPRLLAVRAEPAEAAPGEPVAFHALYVVPSGTLADGPLDWAFCTARKPVTEAGPVDPRCLAGAAAAGDVLVPIGTGVDASGTLPAAGCRLFGPDRPDPVPGEPAGRPADADGTGGYFQPLTLHVGDAVALVEARLRCGLPGATAAQAADFRARSHPNANPDVTEVTLTGAPLVAVESDPGAVAEVAPGATVTLRAAWPRCPADEPSATPSPCAGSEAYVFFDPVTRAIVTRREALRVSWFASAGSFASGHTGRSEAEASAGADDASSTVNSWTAPDGPGDVSLWVVLRDDRGGTAWRSFRLHVGP